MVRERNPMVEEMRRDPTVSEWLENAVKPRTADTYVRNFAYFYGWLQSEGEPRLRGLSPRELVEFQYKILRDSLNNGESLFTDADPKLVVRELVRFCEGGRTETGLPWRSNYKRRFIIVVRSFFSYYLKRKMLSFPELEKGEYNRAVQSERPKMEKELTIREVRDVINASMPMYRAVFSIMALSGVGIEEVIKISNMGIDELGKRLEKTYKVGEVEVAEIYLPYRKHSEKPFYIEIGGSALDNLRSWLKHREKQKKRFYDPKNRKIREEWRRKHPDTDRERADEYTDTVFVNNSYTPLTDKGSHTYWTRRLKRLELVEEIENADRSVRYNKNLHQLRSVFRTQWAKSELGGGYSAEGQKALGEYFLGHTVDKLNYNKIQEDREYRHKAYARALKWLDPETYEVAGQHDEIKELRMEKEKLELGFLKLQAQVTEMTPTFRMAQRLLDRETKLDRLMESSKEP